MKVAQYNIVNVNVTHSVINSNQQEKMKMA